MDLAGKVVVITGAARGIGKAAALEFARRGSDVVVAARTDTLRPNKEGTIVETAHEVEALGRRCLAVRCDLARQEDVDLLVQRTLETFGRCDILVNNAAVTSGLVFVPMADMTREQLGRFLDVNVVAPFMLAKLFAEGMKKAGQGMIVNVTSGSADPVDMGAERDAKETAIGYGTTKAALNRLTNAIARELQPFRIPCIALDPGFTATQGEDMLRQMEERGFNRADLGHPVSWPVNALIYLATCPDPMQYSGRVVVTADFVHEKGLV
jgi:NAD(P)-dependent dehydrogenase (short-subunit alcohol dehydrogenase family)